MKQEKENKTEEESLSEKAGRGFNQGKDNAYMESDVKEAVKKLKLRIFSPIFDSSIKSQNQIEEELLAEIDKIFGDKLI